MQGTEFERKIIIHHYGKVWLYLIAFFITIGTNPDQAHLHPQAFHPHDHTNCRYQSLEDIYPKFPAKPAEGARVAETTV